MNRNEIREKIIRGYEILEVIKKKKDVKNYLF
jgi:hypothetical protein